MDMKMMVPGVPSMPKLIADDRDGYLDALRAVDHAYKTIEPGVHILDRPALLRPMIEYLDDKLVLQLVSQMPAHFRLLGIALRWFMRLGYP